MSTCQICPDSSKHTLPLYNEFFLPSRGRGILMRLGFQNEMDSLARLGNASGRKVCGLHFSFT